MKLVIFDLLSIVLLRTFRKYLPNYQPNHPQKCLWRPGQ
eukprot:Gb_28317 [translate_table: standard]